MRWMTPAILLLAACGGGQEDRAAEAPVSEEKAADRAPAVVAMPPNEAASAADQTNPAAIRGRWAIDAADCAKRPGTDLTVLTIDAAKLRFHESDGELAKVRDVGLRWIVADYSFSGEGMEWDRQMRLEVSDDGKALVRHDMDEGAAAPPMRYMRCT